jgi:hypothetical protein
MHRGIRWPKSGCGLTLTLFRRGNCEREPDEDFKDLELSD